LSKSHSYENKWLEKRPPNHTAVCVVINCE
jgi:hypothetical protein